MLAAMMFAAAVAAGAAGAPGAPAVAGLWRTPGDGGLVEVSRCGASLCAVLLSSDRLRQEPGLKDVHNRDEALRARQLKGLELFKGFKGAGGAWRDGEIYNPHDGGTYHARLELMSPDRLKVTGCLFAPLCLTQIWTRAPAGTAP